MHKDRAFTLRTYPFGEADRIVVFFTEDHGILRGIAKGSLKMKSRISGALEPLTMVNVRFVEKHGRELVVIAGCDALRSVFNAMKDLNIAAAVGLIAELTMEFRADRDPDPAFYRLLEVCQLGLKKGVDPALVMHYFELFTLKLSGVLRPRSDVKVKAAAELVGRMLRTNLLEIGSVEPQALNQLGAWLRRNVREALGKQLKSYSFIDQVLANNNRSS